MPDFAVTTAFRATDRMSPAFRRMSGEVDRFGQHGARAMSRMGRAAQTARGIIMGMVPIAGGFALVGLASRAIELASSLNEVQNVVDVTFGQNASQINRWSQTAITAFGLSELQAKQFTSQIGAMMKSSGIAGQELVTMSTRLTGLAGDFASFYNLPIEEAFDKIRAGIAGETEPLRRLGINMTVANLQAFALSRGIRTQWQRMSQAQQTQLRYAFLMQASADAQGDFNRTLQTSFANQKRVLGVQFDQFLARIATAILPALTRLFRSLNEIMSKLPAEKIGKALSAMVPIVIALGIAYTAWKIATWGVIAAQAAMNIAGWIKYLWMMRGPIMMATRATKAWKIAQWAVNIAMYACPLVIVIALLALLGYGIYKIVQRWNSWGQAINSSLGPLGGAIAFMKTIYDWWDRIKNAFNMGGIIEAFRAFRLAMGEMVLGPIVQMDNLIRRIPGLNRFLGTGPSAAQRALDAIHAEGATYAPNAGRGQGTQFQGTLNINGAPQGSTVQGQTRGPGTMDLALMGAN